MGRSLEKMGFMLNLGAWLLTPAFAFAQLGDLQSDLAKLNVRHRTEHYAIAGTASDARLAEYGRCLEYIYHEYANGFSELLATRQTKQTQTSPSREKIPKQKAGEKDKPSTASGESKNDGENDLDAKTDQQSGIRLPGEDGKRFPVIVYGKPDEYREFSGKYFAGGLEHTLGVYMPNLRLLVIRGDPDSSETYEVLFHEAFHQFAHQYVPLIPMWLNEGLATYYGNAQVMPNGLKFDRPDGLRFQIVRQVESAQRLIPLRELMLYDRSNFYREDRIQICYAQSYTLSAYILQDEAGARHLRGFLKDLATARTTSDVEKITDRCFDKNRLEMMASAWLAYCHRH